MRGKTAAAPRLLLGALSVSEFVNADTIAQGLSAFRPEQAAVAAGRIMLDRLHALARGRETFAFETTLANRSFAPWLQALRSEGYRVHLNFLSLPSAEMALARVQDRVRLGGHDVPAAVVRRRYARGLGNFFSLYITVVDTWQLFDNSNTDEYRLIASGSSGATPAITDQRGWRTLLEQVQ